jgi:cell division protein FtsW (lipid II flippase)
MNKFKHLDFILIIIVLAIILFGIMMIYSASYRGEGLSSEFRRQVTFFLVGLVAMSVMMTADYEFWGKCRSYIYIVAVSCY